jgi:hypothetical protein
MWPLGLLFNSKIDKGSELFGDGGCRIYAIHVNTSYIFVWEI